MILESRIYTDEYVARLHADIQQLKSALQFYADKENYPEKVCLDAGEKAVRGINTFFGNN